MKNRNGRLEEVHPLADGSGPPSAALYARWFIPDEITCRDGWLRWRMAARPDDGAGGYGTPRRRVDEAIWTSARVVNDFLRVRHGHDVSAFARRWGVLGVCMTHGRPGHHPGTRPWLPSLDLLRAGVNAACPPPVDAGGWYAEPLTAWHDLARAMYAVVRMAEATRSGAIAGEELWQDVSGGYLDTPGPDGLTVRAWMRRKLPDPRAVDALLGEQRQAVTRRLDEWMQAGRVRLAPSYDPHGQLQPGLTAEGLLGALAARLFTHVAAGRPWVPCSACGQMFFPHRRPRAGAAHYCDACGTKAAQREATRRYQERVRQGQAVHARQRPCAGCGQTFTRDAPAQRYCSAQCRARGRHERQVRGRSAQV